MADEILLASLRSLKKTLLEILELVARAIGELDVALRDRSVLQKPGVK